MRKVMIAAAAAATLAANVSLSTKAEARCYGCWAGAAVAAGIIGSAIVANRAYGYGYYGGYAPYYGGYYGGYGGYYGGYAPAYYEPAYSYSYAPAYYGYAPAYYAPRYYYPRRAYYGGYRYGYRPYVRRAYVRW